ncbi:J domain-containing protein [Psidium guajava]|nr:J domain-containing protein [Psidium guajava]
MSCRIVNAKGCFFNLSGLSAAPLAPAIMPPNHNIPSSSLFPSRASQLLLSGRLPTPETGPPMAGCGAAGCSARACQTRPRYPRRRARQQFSVSDDGQSREREKIWFIIVYCF